MQLLVSVRTSMAVGINRVEVTTWMSEYILPHDDVIKWKHFLRHWPFVRGIHRSPVHSPHKGHWRGALMFSLICVWINGWVNNGEAGDLRRYRAHYDVTVMLFNRGNHLSMACSSLLIHVRRGGSMCFVCSTYFGAHKLHDFCVPYMWKRTSNE